MVRRLLVVGVVLAAASFGRQWLEPAPTTAAPVTVVSITDGDTFRSSVGPIRIDNIEAPDSTRHPQRKTPECVDPAGAEAATAQLAALLPVGTVVELHRTGTSYGRIVALVSVGGEDVGRLMLKGGSVDTYPVSGGPCPWD
jgi:endonuclease YncB( thermonuclease family)